LISMGAWKLARPSDRHLDTNELAALALALHESVQDAHGISPAALLSAERHLAVCGDCRRKVAQYRQLVNGTSSMRWSEAPRPECPRDEDVDWHEVAAGLWPELRAKQLIMHAALCDHCGPLLRAAASGDEATLQEEILLAQLKAPSRPEMNAVARPSQLERLSPPIWRRFIHWKMVLPAMAVLVILAVLASKSRISLGALSGPNFAEVAVITHKQHAEGRLALDVRSDSQQRINEWLRTHARLPALLPTTPFSADEVRPCRLEGARLVQVAGKPAAFIAYEVQTPKLQTVAASLLVTPDSAAVASGGVELDFKKVSFHYATVNGYKVVTWTLHGLTYALVSQEGNNTQRSCMVCHSGMRDRDLSQTPTPLHAEKSALGPIWQ
jgi:anti-sigma factor RsiW